MERGLAMNSERHYPIAFRFVSVALMAFALTILYKSIGIRIRLYALIVFFATLNGWIASEDDNKTYGNLYLINDALCSSCFFLMMLELNDGKYEHFFLYSVMIFGLYIWWNVLLSTHDSNLKPLLRKYQICNTLAGIYSLFTFLVVKFNQNLRFKDYVQSIGMIMWIAVLLVWYYDFYFKIARPQKHEDKKARSPTKKGNG